MHSARKILICPLDWGLGHATRCIPIIRALKKRGAEIYIASSGPALALLKIEFPSNKFFQLPSYSPEYSKNSSLAGKMLRQLPKFRKAIAAEHVITKEIVRTNAIDVVISDNRYGCWAPRVQSILITHQLKISMPRAYQWAAAGVNWILQQQIKKFKQVWIPDQPASGLTDPFYSKVVVDQRYIGWLSRFGSQGSSEKIYDVVAIISGPEPQRTIFFEIVRKQMIALKMRSLIVCGKPGEDSSIEESGVTIVSHLPSEQLERAIVASGVVVCRSGYSTVMDLIALKKNAIFVPTPGQPEQNLLAMQLGMRRIVFSQPQDEFEIRTALLESGSYTGLSEFKPDNSYLSKALDSILK